MVTARTIQSYILTTGLLLLILLMPFSQEPKSVAAQEDTQVDNDAVVETIFNALTPNERIGQLFLVSFDGSDISADSDIAELIQTYRIGGVTLSAETENFINSQSTPSDILTLTNGLQTLAFTPPALSSSETISATPIITTTGTVTESSYTSLPLFIATTHEGDGFPYTQIRGELIEVPSAMAIGATWNAENARLVGQVVGQELSRLGVNMLLGPSLDVLDNPRPDRDASLGIRSFGGHAYWVGEMGSAYIQGVHQGSNEQVLTIAKHFPGFGSSDRQINQGVPTILKSLDDLRQTDLAPFFRVTQLPSESSEAMSGLADGLMTAHIRYQGLQGNIPISLDARNLPAILASEEIAPWHTNGGLILSAPLGVPAALEGIATNNDSFPARRLAQDAFLAGSDILYLADFAFADDDIDTQMVNIKNAIEFFQEKYETDPNFQGDVDQAVKRIIKAKIKIYGSQLLATDTQKSEADLSLPLDTTVDLDQIAQAGVTLITPLTQEGGNPLPNAPQADEQILIFTDDRVAQDCPDCPEFSLIEISELETTILELFGLEATGQILPQQLTSRSFADLKDALAEEPVNELQVAETEALIEEADWIIFAMLNVDVDNHPQSDAVRDLLRNRYEIVRNKNLILFAFNAPYFLDETEISQLTAYYSFYSKGRSY
ncbi:MAG: glycoside hydrolase family 3 N-terminal domain-containing protein, partial [Chloroflexota bacterium]